MTFLIVNGITVPVSDAQEEYEVEGDDSFTEQSLWICRRRQIRRLFKANTPPCLTTLEEEGLRTLIGGLGHHWAMETTRNSSRGAMPAALVGTLVGTGRFGNCLRLTSSPCSYDLSHDGLSVLDRWTIFIWVNEGAQWDHYAISSDGRKIKNGSFFFGATPFVTILNDIMTLTPTVNPTLFDDVTLLYGCMSTEQMLSVWSWQQNADNPFSDLPLLTVEGDMTGNRISALGETDTAPFQLIALDTWKNNAHSLGFTIWSAQQNDAIPQLPNPLVYATYDAADSIAGVPVDVTIPDSNLSLIGSPSVVAGVSGEARHLSAGQGIAIDSAVPNFGTSTSFTICSWVKLDTISADGQQAIIGKFDGSSFGWFFALDCVASTQSATLRMSVTNAAQSAGHVGISTVAIQAGKWHHVAVTYEGSSLPQFRMQFYIDGDPVGVAQVLNSSIGAPSNALDACWGRSSATTPTRQLLGSIDESAIWLTELQPSDISVAYISGRRRQRLQFRTL